MKRSLPLLPIILLSASPALAHGGERHAEAHVHGKATLTLSLENKTFSLDLLGPSANFTAASGAVVIDGTNASAAQIVTLPKAAQCHVKTALLETKSIDADMQDDHHHDDADDHDHGEDHDHGDEHDHGDPDEHDAHAGHSDSELKMSWECKRPDKLKSATLNIFKTWTGFTEVQTLFLTDEGANAKIMTPSSTKIDRP